MPRVIPVSKHITTLVALLLLLVSCGAEPQQSAKGFTLKSLTGPVSLHDFKGKAVLLFFGYTHCPDVCPATMNNVAMALRTLGEQADQVSVLFVTVDPERDSVTHLEKYAAFFHPNIIGLSGSQEEVRGAAAQFNVEFFKQVGEEKDRYEVIHTSRLFMINWSGEILDVMSHHTEPDDIAIALRKWLNSDLLN